MEQTQESSESSPKQTDITNYVHIGLLILMIALLVIVYIKMKDVVITKYVVTNICGNFTTPQINLD